MPIVPRSIWLATGAVAAALLGPALIGQAGAADAGAPIRTAAVLGLTLATVVGGLALRSALARRTLAPLVVGLVLIGVRLALSTPAPAQADTVVPGGSGPWTGRVVGVGSPRAGQQAATVLLDDPGLRVAATLPRYPEIAPGDRVSIGGRLEALPADDGGYGDYLRRIGVVATLRARTLDRIGTDGSASSVVEAARRGSGEALTRALPEPEAGLAAGILIGLRDRVDRDLAAAFTTAGVSHVVAISGWNIAIVAALVAACCEAGSAGAGVARHARRDRRATRSPPAPRRRSSGPRVMAAVVLLARESGRAGAAAAALGWAAVAPARRRPGDGRRRRVPALVARDGWAHRLGDADHRPGCAARGGSAAGLAGREPRRLVRRARRRRCRSCSPGSAGSRSSLRSSTSSSCRSSPPAMAAGTLALVGGWPCQAGAPARSRRSSDCPPGSCSASSMVGRPLAAAPAVRERDAGPAADRWWSAPAVAVVVLAGARHAARSALRVAAPTRGRPRHGGARRRAATVARGPSPPEALRLAGRSARPVASLARGRRRRRRGRASSWPRTDRTAASGSTVLDVGQGDAILVEGDRGGRLLVDGGPDPDRLLVALDAASPPWDRRIDLLVLTHPHEDHVAGLAPARGPLSGRPHLRARDDRARTGLPRLAGGRWLATGCDRRGSATGDRFDLDQVRFRVLWPDPRRGARASRPTAARRSTTCRSCCSARSDAQRFLLAGRHRGGDRPDPR